MSVSDTSTSPFPTRGATRPSGAGIDPRGPRTAAWITTTVLAAVLLGGDAGWAVALLAAQTLVFALGTRGRSPYGWLFRRVVRPRLGPPAELEAEAPTRFAQVVGLGFAVVGTLALALGATVVGTVAVAFALAAAFLNAAFGLCLGCELYLLVARLTTPANNRQTGATA